MTTQPTNQELKLALAKMLPEKLWLNTTRRSDGYCFCWTGKRESLTGYDEEIKETELLHVCWLVEEGLSSGEQFTYRQKLGHLVIEERKCGWTKAICHATWQQRAIALCKVKGIKI
jgi:hypothetical protein